MTNQPPKQGMPPSGRPPQVAQRPDTKDNILRLYYRDYGMEMKPVGPEGCQVYKKDPTGKQWVPDYVADRNQVTATKHFKDWYEWRKSQKQQ